VKFSSKKVYLAKFNFAYGVIMFCCTYGVFWKDVLFTLKALPDCDPVYWFMSFKFLWTPKQTGEPDRKLLWIGVE
jgi:hypothetical protein